ncbi:MAG TPA: hypothetical protein VF834_15780 [Streptosporangiaceae bacterium]
MRPRARLRAIGSRAIVPAQRGGGHSDESAEPRPAMLYRIDWDGLRKAARACCCPAQPAVMVVIPPAPGRGHRTDLLLCMHHFRMSREALTAAGAMVLGPDRELIAPDAVAYLPAAVR